MRVVLSAEILTNYLSVNYRKILAIQSNLSITDTLGPGHFLLQYRGLSLSEVKNVSVTPVGAKIFVLIMEVFSIVSLIQRVCQERSQLYCCGYIS